MDDVYQQTAASAICHAASMAGEEVRAAAAEYARPSVVWKPKLCVDGKQWCALLGDNFQEGVAGFGDSPASAQRSSKFSNKKLTQTGATSNGTRTCG